MIKLWVQVDELFVLAAHHSVRCCSRHELPVKAQPVCQAGQRSEAKPWQLF